jgi:hypothetical protein
MGWLLLRSLGTLVVFQGLALAVAVAGRRGRATVVAVGLIAGLVAIGLLSKRLDPLATFAGAVAAGWLVERGLRRGESGFGRLSIVAAVPVIAATLVTLLGSDPSRAWADLQAQVEALAGVEAGADSAAAPGSAAPPPPMGTSQRRDAPAGSADSSATPEDRLRHERTQELSQTAARWALRLLPVELGVFAWLQVLMVMALTRRVAIAAGVPVALPPPSRWQVPFGWIWALALGLGLVAMRQSWSTIAGANLVALAAAVLAVQGGAVMLSTIERSSSPVVRALLLAVLAVAAWPLFAGGLAMLGAADLWVDFRRQRSAPDVS